MLREGLRRRLADEFEGEVLFDAFSRGRYATDASHYQIMPAGVAVPKSAADVARALAAAREDGVPVTMRGGGTSQCGQTINTGLILDGSRHLNRILDLDVAGRRALVQPGIVLDELNRQLRPHGLWFPVDVSTASRATIGGMVGNNSCGARSLRYGTTRDNVISIQGLLADGSEFDFGPGSGNSVPEPLLHRLLGIGEREAREIARRFPQVQRRVGGYNIDALVPNGQPVNLAHLLVGSEGTLAVSTAIEIKLSPLPAQQKAQGVCHFPTFRAAMEAAQHLVKLDPTQVELVDRTMLNLAREIPVFVPTLDAFVKGDPAALLFVEFDDPDTNAERIAELHDTMSDLGYGFGRGGAQEGGVVEVWDAKLMADIGELRKSGLNIMMSMKEAGKPVSFVEDAAVPLEHLADYTDRLTDVFRKHGTEGTWYAHASEGCLHVRPVLNLRLEKDVKAMRAIAEEAFDMVRDYKGSHSGEHGDGIVRSEFHVKMFGPRLVRAFEEVKDAFDPERRFNPNKIVEPPRMDDRSLLRYPEGYRFDDLQTGLDWSAWSGASGGFQGAIEMCNNNGACRKLSGGVMCPSYRVTRNERDVTRGRANALRLALSGRLGRDALFSDEMAETLKLCVGCKACQRECPTGVDMAKMKTEVLHQRGKKLGFSLKDRLIAEMPRYARLAARAGPLFALRERVPAVAKLAERITGISARRTLPRFRRDAFREAEITAAPAGSAGEVVLFADSFNRWMEPEIPRAALRVLTRAGYTVHSAMPGGERPLCCGRTYLAAGMLGRARAEARRTLEALLPHVEAGRPVIGLEPSCLLTLRDEFKALLPGEEAERLARHALLFEEFVARETAAGRMQLPFSSGAATAHVHGHCHQKAAGAMGDMERALAAIPGLDASVIQSSCCGMAGAFGYGADTIDVSLAMGEAELLPAVRRAAPDALIIANGTSCRHQIADGTRRRALHIAEVFDRMTSDAKGDRHDGQSADP
ncbi:FAD-binding and (Fe-S)-binding domain-containing protein [Limimaricola pyoseonensis]|uniref:D-2-hydroxyglutarate dehydrogenase n=1 Tax=Limimaricola pyoseonensis TaxID=521013 RepID=A0A1G7KQL8_9RHOB|nr:FAD-binding and (Fe-S)-binding domain-containing protein [Limimaricola pyoseonensis]SDF39451.1 FAD/FMN-containing dehydrogenase [Limimaricola pyoseonensis]